MKRYNIDICTCDGREAVNHTKDVPDNYGGWVKYDDAAARIAKLEAQLTAAKEREAAYAEYKRKLEAIVMWLERNEPSVFARGLWDAINE